MMKELNIPKEWSGPEEWVWGEIRSGRIADFNMHYNKKLDPKKPEGWNNKQEDRRLSQAFLITILTEESFQRLTPFQGVRICGAYIEESIDLRHVRIEQQLWLETCRVDGGLDLRNFQVNGWLSLKNSWIGGEMDLSFSMLASNVEFSRTQVKSRTNLTGTKIGGMLYMNGITIDGSLEMSGVEVVQNLLMTHGATFKEVILMSAKIGGSFSMKSSTFNGRLMMDGVKVCESLVMNKAIFKDVVGLNSAKIGLSINLSGSTFEGSLNMNGIEVGQYLSGRNANFLRNGPNRFSSAISLNLRLARIGSDLNLSGATIKSIDLTGANVLGELCLGSHEFHSATKWAKDSQMILRNTTVGTIQDINTDIDSWPEALVLVGFTYHRLGGYGAYGKADISKRDINWFIEWLKREKRFSPQPYEQLANLFRELGYPSKANDILFAARKRTRIEAWLQHEDKPREFLRWIGMMFLEATIGYGIGVRYFRVLWWFFAITLIGILVLLCSIERSNWDLFKMAWASLDQVLPIVTLNEIHEKFIMEKCGYWSISYFYVQKVFGYILGGFLGAGLAGLTQKS